MSEAQIVATSAYGDWIGRTSLLDDGTKWIMAYRVATEHVDDANAKICLRFSTDEGVNWTAENTFTDGEAVTGAPFSVVGQQDMSMPTLVKAPNGDIVLIASVAGVGASQWRSTDAGASWTAEGVISPAYDEFDELLVVGAEIYATTYEGGYNADLVKSTDSAATWEKVSDITIDAEGFDTNEHSLCNPSGSKLLVVMRGYSQSNTYSRMSEDLGATWGPMMSNSAWVGLIQRPRVKIFSATPNRIYLVGRKYVSDTDTHTAIAYSPDGGTYWYDLFNLEDEAQTDCGYCDILQKADGDLFIASYRGDTHAATIYGYVVRLLPN